MSRRTITALVGLSAGLLLAGNAIADTVTLNVMHAWPSHKRFHEPLAQEFMKLHPDIAINYMAPAESYTDGQQKILRGAMTDTLPDVYYSSYAYLGEMVRVLAEHDRVNDLSPLLAAEGADWRKANYADNVLQLGQLDSKQWAIPFTASTAIVYYNKDLFKSVGADPEAFPDNWDGVIDVAKKIAAAGQADGLSYAVNDWGDDWLWQALILNYGGSMMDPQKTHVTFGDAAGQKAVHLIRRFVTETKMPFLNEDQAIQQFASGKLGIFVGSTAEVRTMNEAVGRKFQYGTAGYPVADKEKGGLPTGGSAAVILTKDEAKQKAAWEFIKFVTGPKGQEIVVRNSGYMPTNLRTAGAEYLGEFYEQNPDWTTSLKQWLIAKSWFGYPGTSGPRIWDEQKIILSQIMRGEVGEEDGLAQLVATTEKLAKGD